MRAGAKWKPQLEQVFEGVKQESDKPFLKYSPFLDDWVEFIRGYPSSLEDVAEGHRPPFSLPLIAESEGLHLVSHQGIIYWCHQPSPDLDI